MRDIFGLSTFAWGEFGVDIFFVISGFVMIYSVSPERPKITPIEFMTNRVFRIAPMYWLLTALMAIAVTIKPDPFKSASLTAGHLIQSLFFIPHYHPKIEGAVLPLLVPGWTLNYEMYFYIILSAFLAFKGFVRIFLISVALLIGFSVGTFLDESGSFFKFLSDSIVFEFAFGMIICEAYLRGFALPVKFAVPLSIFSFLAIILASNLDYRFATAGVWSALLVYSCVSLNFKLNGVVGSFLKSLGDSSYSLYLSHIFVIGGVGFLWRKTTLLKISEGYLTASIYMILCSLFSMTVGYIIFKTVEQNLMMIFKKPRVK